jgi:uncharacterized membrane protein YphA (DoxX/SURF4 family)
MAAVLPNSKIAVVARILLALIFIVFGLNFFFHFLPATGPDPASKAGLFLGGLFGSGYFFAFLKVLEVLFGFLLLTGFFVPLTLILLFPISINIFLFHLVLAPAPLSLAIAITLLILNIYLAWVYRSAYKPLFHAVHHIDEPAPIL